jgi:hypothetical protein
VWPITPFFRHVTNYPVRNRNDYTVPRCRLSLYQSSFIPSVINLWNSLDNDTRNTRTFDTFKINLKRKVVLAKIPAHFLVGDRRPNVLYARLRRNCSSLKHDLGTDHLTWRGGGYGFLFRSEICFRTTQELEYLYFLSRIARIFFPKFNFRLYDKNSGSDYFFFLHQNQNIFFSNIGNQNIFLEKTITPPSS